MKNKRTSGISLVALIVTIIVLIILTAAVIVTFMEGGIIEKAKEAVFKSDIRTYQEILAVKNAENQIEIATGNGEGTQLNADTLEKIQTIIPEFKEEYKDLIVISNGEIVLGAESKEPYSIWLSDLGIGVAKTSAVALMEVGDYVKYIILEEERKEYNITEKLGAEATNWIFNDIDESWSYAEGEEVIGYNEEIKWRVLKNNGTTVTLVSAEPVENIYLYGEEGFIQGPATLDSICAEVYGGRNLRVEDVNELLKQEPVAKYYNSDGEQVDKKLKTTIGDVMEETGLSISGRLPGNYEEIELYYTYNKSACTNASEIAKDMIFDNYYWLSSSHVGVDFSYDRAGFCVGNVVGDRVTSYDLYVSYGEEDGNLFGLRPVVTLNASTLVADVTGDGSSADNAWQLK